jgi:WD40 repeat protein
MPLSAGARLGPYEIRSALGAGGMGEVYRARDIRLDRDVAIKILPEAFGADAERVARFQREAKVLASLNHPHIAAIYGLEDAEGVTALVMELVEGEDLALRLERGALPLDEALPIAKQIAEALEAAHEQGIIHRDLKPANIILRSDGTVKVLDFGLAKALEPLTVSGGNVMASPTITSPALTQIGIILGTAAYMSPEQGKGRQADKRSDVWAFGAVLYEILSGQRAFKGDDISDTLAAVLRQDIDWHALPAHVPSPVRGLIARCLDRDVRRRLRDIGEARIVLDGPVESAVGAAATVSPRRPLPRRALPMALAALAGGLLGAGALWYAQRATTPPPLDVARFSVQLPTGLSFTQPMNDHSIAVSPDGQRVVYAADNRLFLRLLSGEEARPIPGTEGFVNTSSPAFSPDSRSIAFFADSDRTLRTIAVTGGSATRICSIAAPYGISWGPTGILVGQGDKGIIRVSLDEPTPQVILRVKEGEAAHGPQLLPDGQHVLFTLATGIDIDRWDRARIVVQALGSETPTTLVDGASDARYEPTTGQMVYADAYNLLARPFDVRRRTFTGRAVPIADSVVRSSARITGAAGFGVSRRSLVYIPGLGSSPTQTDFELRLTDPTGQFEHLKLPPGRYSTPRVSPDGTRLALGVQDGNQARIAIYDLSGATGLRQLTLPGNNRFPIWSRDSKRLTFQSDREGDLALFHMPADGGPVVRLTTPDTGDAHQPEDWSPMTDTLLFSVTKKRDVSLWTRSSPGDKIAPFGNVHSIYPLGARFSRDGRWVAYSVRGEDRARIYVAAYPEFATTGDAHELLISGNTIAAHKVAWSAGSNELFYIPRIREFEAVRFTTQPTFMFGETRKVPRPFDIAGGPNMRTQYDITPAGKFVGLFLPGETNKLFPTAFSVILNWSEELKALMPTQ